MDMLQEEEPSPMSAENPQPQSHTKVLFSVVMKALLVMLRQLLAPGEEAAATHRLADSEWFLSNSLTWQQLKRKEG